MDLVTWLLAGREHRELSTRVDRHLAQLSEHAGLVDRLATYLACDLDVGATASRLFVHPNTVRYRLSRTEGLLGGSLRDTATIVNAYLALQDAVQERSAPG
jgi:purine catabolism regulator